MTTAVSTKQKSSEADRPLTLIEQAGYQEIQTLGEGAFGNVILVVHPKTPDMALAMKKINLEDGNREKLNLIRKEYLIQRRVSQEGGCRNVIRTLGLKADPYFYYLFLEYADGGELFDKIEPDVGMQPCIAQYYFRQLIEGLEYIHSADIVHRDIKPENLLLTTSHVLKISDFGMATLYRHGDVERLLDLSCGTIPYAAPEVCAGRKYKGPPVDIWSCGIVLIAMLSGELPWERACDASANYLCWLDNSNLDENPWKKIGVRALCLLRKILVEDPDKRATNAEIMSDLWFTQNFGKLDSKKGRPLKRRYYENDENDFSSTQQAEYAFCAKRAHFETPSPNQKTLCVAERQNASFSQPTNFDDLLLSQGMEMSQNTKITNIMQRMVCRMTRFCVNVTMEKALEKIRETCDSCGYEMKQYTNLTHLVTHCNVSMMVSLYTTDEGSGTPRIMIDFRRSRGDGIQFKKMFIMMRDRLVEIMCINGNEWLADSGITPQSPTFTRGDAVSAHTTTSLRNLEI